MKNINSELSFLDLFIEVYRKKYLILMITFLGLIISILISMMHIKLYESSIILNNKKNNEVDSNTDLNTLTSLLNFQNTKDNTLSKIIKVVPLMKR